MKMLGTNELKQVSFYFYIIFIVTGQSDGATIRQGWARGPVDTCKTAPNQSVTYNLDRFQADSVVQCLAYMQPKDGSYRAVSYNKTTKECSVVDDHTAVPNMNQQYITEERSSPIISSIDDKVKCTNTWTKLYEVAADGSPLFGDITAITDALKEGAEFRIHILPELFLEITNAALKSGLVCASSLFVLSKSNWDTFASSMFWRYTMVCSDGMVYQARTYLGKQEQLPSLQSSSHSIWYTRKLKGTQQRPNPLYCTDSTFDPTCNNVAEIISTSEQGMSIRVAYHFGTSAYYLNSLHRLEVDSGSCGLVAQMAWKVGKSASSGRYYTPLYWYIALIDTKAIRTITRWYIGDHSFNSESTGSLLYTEWFVDTCWALVFSHGVNGEPLSGSKETLTELILQGRRVQVVFGPYTMEADNVVIDNDIVTAQLLGQIDTLTSASFKPGMAEWKWVRIASNGKYNVDLYDIGAPHRKGQSTSTVQASWVIESRVWRLVLRTDSSGNDAIGSKAHLKKALKDGSRLRCVIYEQPTVTLVVTADNIEMSVDDNIAAQVFRLISFDDSDTGFIPFWRILLITTKGELKETRWTVGEHHHRGNVVNLVQIDWFVD